MQTAKATLTSRLRPPEGLLLLLGIRKLDGGWDVKIWEGWRIKGVVELGRVWQAVLRV